MLTLVGTTVLGWFGRGVSPKVAQILGGAIMLAVGVGMFFAAKAVYDHNVVSDYKQEQAAKAAKETLKAERRADANAAPREAEFEESQRDIERNVTNAIAKDPAKGKTVAGPATQSYFDSLPGAPRKDPAR